jgi:hypothetical protein
MPPGVSFAPNDIPDHKGTIVTGSKTVHLAGSCRAKPGRSGSFHYCFHRWST